MAGFARHSFVMTCWAWLANAGVRRRGAAVDRSMPSSRMTSTTAGCVRSAGYVPAETAHACEGSAFMLKMAAAI